MIEFNSQTKEYAWLSNFAPADILLDGLRFASVEHAYQAAKARLNGHPELVARIARSKHPAEAKRIAKLPTGRSWDEERELVMLALMMQKFADPWYQKKLLETGDERLVHLAPWDEYWGTGRHGKGLNRQGLLTEKVRTQLRRESTVGEKIRVQGFVAKLFEKSGTNARGQWTAYSIKLQRVSGEEDPRFYQFGFEKPGFKEGDFVEFEAEIKDDKAAKFIEGTGKKPKNPPARPAQQARPAFRSVQGGYAGKKGGGGGYKPREPLKSEVFGLIGGNNTEDDIRRMSYTVARSAALDAVALLLAHDALPMSTAKTKAGQASRFDEVSKMIDKITVEYYFDAAGGRKLVSVADAGSKETRVAPLPDAEPGKKAPESEATDELPEDPDVSDEQVEAEGGDFADEENDETF